MFTHPFPPSQRHHPPSFSPPPPGATTRFWERRQGRAGDWWWCVSSPPSGAAPGGCVFAKKEALHAAATHVTRHRRVDICCALASTPGFANAQPRTPSGRACGLCRRAYDARAIVVCPDLSEFRGLHGRIAEGRVGRGGCDAPTGDTGEAVRRLFMMDVRRPLWGRGTLLPSSFSRTTVQRFQRGFSSKPAALV